MGIKNTQKAARTRDRVHLQLAEAAVRLEERLELQALVGGAVPPNHLLRGRALELHHEAEHLIVVAPREGDPPGEELEEAAADGPVYQLVSRIEIGTGTYLPTYPHMHACTHPP